MKFFADLYAVMATIPFFTFVVIYLLVKWLKGDRRTALIWAMNITTFFLISAVTAMYGLLAKPAAAAFYWWILLFWLLVSGVLGFLQIKLKGRIQPVKLTVVTWKLTFFVLAAAYILLFFMGIAQYIRMT